jgi:tRNA threonylcarbamoyladenosine biosynthesis protein TsaB
MGLILCIETATEVCSVALARNGKLLELKESSERNVHSAMLTLFIGDIIKSSEVTFNEIDAVAVSMGPGSYTGLRIGVAAAKGLCFATEKPLIAIPTLRSMAAGMNEELKKSYSGGTKTPLFCPMIDARRMEVYSEIYDENGKSIREVRAEIIDSSSFQEFLAHHTVVFGGGGADKCRAFLGDNPNAIFLDGFTTSANYMVDFSEEKFNHDQFENLTYFEPFYLKDFVAGKPRVKGLG